MNVSVTEMIKGKTVEEAEKLTNAAVVESLGGLPAQKMHCSVLAEEAIAKSLDVAFAKAKENGRYF